MYLDLDPQILKEILETSVHPRTAEMLGTVDEQTTGANSPDNAGAIDEARARYAADSDGDIEIDPDAVVSPSDTGFFVQAWVFVPKE